MDFMHSQLENEGVKAYMKASNIDTSTFPLNSNAEETVKGKTSNQKSKTDSEGVICHFCGELQNNPSFYITCTNSYCKKIYCINCIAIMNVVSYIEILIFFI